jgi:lysophospholipase L1-like esterase
MKNRCDFILTSLLATTVLWQGDLQCFADDQVPTAATCKAATPIENPWTKRLPAGWWKQRHEDILAAPGRKECQLVFIGDSITDGWDQEGGGLKIWDKEYVPMKALNLGINCDSTQHVLWRLDHGEIDGMPDLKVAVIMIGVNNKGITRDGPEEIALGIEAICGRVKAKAPQAKILLLGVFPRLFGKDNNDDVNGVIAKLDDGKQIFYLNINEKLLATEGAIQDRVGHVTEKGYEVWADAIRPELKKLMAEPSESPPFSPCSVRPFRVFHVLGEKVNS